ncbi:hypothetical protein [Halofilum ochraceum]|uniref:hypothetical protein n=1 Tax=Halofilum ochraceum TaxID=1611323 RepID=UPI00082A505C|nr:hypothetical protein [Halofilum ochraceum]
MTQVFREGVAATDPAYINLRDSDSDPARAARELTESLWLRYSPYADDHFLDCIPHEFDERFWEMYLTCSLLELGFDVHCPKPGPDILIEADGGRVWIEAVTPTSGALGHPDAIPEPQFGKAGRVPEEQILLRMRSAIQGKYETKYREYRDKGVIGPDDSYVVAVNGCQLHHAIADDYPPWIAKAVFPIGGLQVALDRESLEVAETSYQYRGVVEKCSGSSVSTDIFLDQDYRDLSGVLYSKVDAGNPTARMGDDFILVHNPLANMPLDAGLLGCGKELAVRVEGDHGVIEDTDWNSRA